MLTLLSSLKGLIKPQTFTADNHVFRLHYRFTVAVLAIFCIVVTSSQFFGDAISCTKTGDKNTDEKMVNNFCWADSTYSSEDAFDKPYGNDYGVVYPGVGQSKTGDIYHKYYQWVCFVLALQAVIFYIPRYIWKVLEGEKVKSLTTGLNLPASFHEDVKAKREALVTYLKVHRGLHQKYTFSYVFCEFLNLANVIGQVFLLDTFLGGQFKSFGLRVVQYAYQETSEKTDPMIRLFPRLTKCRFVLQGPSGGNSVNYVICVLPLNIINEKIFIFLWFWFVILISITFLNMLYRIVVFQWSTVRAALLKARCPVSSLQDVQSVTAVLSLGDWFLVYQLAKNVEPIHMGKIIHSLAEGLQSGQEAWTNTRSEVKKKLTHSQEDLV